jgi:hypothetical protein
VHRHRSHPVRLSSTLASRLCCSHSVEVVSGLGGSVVGCWRLGVLRASTCMQSVRDDWSRSVGEVLGWRCMEVGWKTQMRPVGIGGMPECTLRMRNVQIEAMIMSSNDSHSRLRTVYNTHTN